MKHCRKHDSETYDASIFLLILLQYTNIHTQNVLKKPLMSRKHSFSPRLAALSSISFIVRCIATVLPYIYLYIWTLDPCVIVSSCHQDTPRTRHHPRPLWHFITSPPSRSHDPSCLNCSSDSQVQDEGKKAEITVWSRSSWHQCARRGPRCEEQDRIAWVGFELSVCGDGVGWVGWG